MGNGVVIDTSYLITDDERTMYRIVGALNAAGKVTLVSIALGGGFDRAHFENGQGCFDSLLDDTDENNDGA